MKKTYLRPATNFCRQLFCPLIKLVHQEIFPAEYLTLHSSILVKQDALQNNIPHETRDFSTQCLSHH